MANERGAASIYRHDDGSAVAVGAERKYFVLDADGDWALSDTGPSDGYIAYDINGNPVLDTLNPAGALVVHFAGAPSHIIANIPQV